jgi:hypothetical protein
MKQKKNKTKQVVTWPTVSLFSIKELHRLNPKFVEITLRVRLAKAIESGKVVEIGSSPGEQGRPKKVFSMTPVTQITLNKARAEQINLVDNADRLVHVMSVVNQPPKPQVNPVSLPAIPTMR